MNAGRYLKRPRRAGRLFMVVFVPALALLTWGPSVQAAVYATGFLVSMFAFFWLSAD